MVLTIVKKELRETWIFAALAVGVYLVYLCMLTGRWSTAFTHSLWWIPGRAEETPDVPFIQDNFSTMLFFINDLTVG